MFSARVFCCVMCAVFACSEAILNAGGDGDVKNTICEQDPCTCISRGAITVKCVCDASSKQEVDFQAKYRLHPNTHVLNIVDCPHVVIAANMLEGLTSLRRVELSNIANLTVHEHGFAWKLNESLLQTPYQLDGITITIANSTLTNIPSYTFQGRLFKVALINARVENIASFAFTNLYGIGSIDFVDTNVTNWEPQALKKFAVDSVTLSRGFHGSLPSRMMVDIEVTTALTLERLVVDQIRSSAIIASLPKSFTIVGCLARRIEGEAFRVVTHGPIVIRDNTFLSLQAGAFAGITVDKYFFNTEGHQKLTFANNNITHFEANALVFNTSRISPKIERVSIDQTCKCELIESWYAQLTNHPPNQLRTQDNKDSPDYLCLQDKQYTTFHDYQTHHCGVITTNIHILLIIIVSSSALLLVIGVVIVCVCRRRRGDSRRWTNVSTSNTDGDESDGRKRRDGRLVVPEGRMYRETELQVIVEQAEPINDQPIYQNFKPKPAPRTLNK